ncbi:hypothetical protein LRS13_18155 [Svornostia abyssi]|uniref:Alkaline phosphatase n=1 Tax=Svornostia abyssi TaxID=2898438 RepID=A0ABY5PD95_9ACTN|nr:hypothetical protein LRS13_18155 [Parviterribacteraceae bacterium J379]
MFRNTTTRRVAISAATAITALSFGMAEANAATVGRMLGPDLNEPGNDKVQYDAGSGANDLKITRSGSSIIFEDPTEVITPTDAWCAQFNDHKVTCYSQPGFISGMIGSVQAYMDEGDDQVLVDVESGIGVSVSGEEGEDTLESGATGHLFFGGDDDDTLIGGGGEDQIYGDGGSDTITGGAGVDDLNGGAGADKVFAKDGEVDDVSCGTAIDSAELDQDDVRSSCEVVTGLQLAPPPAPQDPPADAQPVPPAPPADGGAAAAPAPVPAPAGTAVSRAARQLKVGVKALKLTRSGRLVVRVSCPKTAVGTCKVTLSGRGVAKRTVSVKAGASKVVTLKLSGARKGAAKRGKRVSVALGVGASDAQLKAVPLKVQVARRAR